MPQKAAATLVNLGVLLQADNKLPEAEQRLEEAVNIFKNNPRHDPGELAAALDGLGKVLRSQGQAQKAETYHLEAVAIYNALDQGRIRRSKGA